MATARDEAARLLELLVREYSSYFDSRGYLNSEGRKVLERAARTLLREERWLKKYVARARKRGSYEDVVRLLELLLGASESS